MFSVQRYRCIPIAFNAQPPRCVMAFSEAVVPRMSSRSQSFGVARARLAGAGPLAHGGGVFEGLGMLTAATLCYLVYLWFDALYCFIRR